MVAWGTVDWGTVDWGTVDWGTVAQGTTDLDTELVQDTADMVKTL